MSGILNNTMYKLKSEKKLNVGYFGGSITFGVAASDKDKTSWRALTTEFLKESFKEAEITERNAAVSGTGTGYALFRVDEDLLKYNPDLVFIEFSINDIYQKYSIAESIRFYESVLRRIYAHNPSVDIIMVITTDKEYIGKTCDMMEAHKKLAAHYNIPVINVGKALYEEMQKTGNSVDMYIADWVHPADAGYKVYAATVCDFLTENFTDADGVLAKALPTAICENLISENVKVLYPERDENVILKGYTEDKTAWGGALCPNWSSNAGDECIFEFDGTYLGMWIESRPAAQAPKNLVAEIDGEIHGPLDCSKEDCSLIHVTIAGELKSGHHLVKLKNIDGGKFRLVRIFTA